MTDPRDLIELDPDARGVDNDLVIKSSRDRSVNVRVQVQDSCQLTDGIYICVRSDKAEGAGAHLQLDEAMALALAILRRVSELRA